eukprot:SAG11_NODE_4250_length_1986_cov_1.946476_4_plen_84_part_00
MPAYIGMHACRFGSLLSASGPWITRVVACSEVRTYYFPYEAYMAGDGKAYEEWAKPFFEAVTADQLWKDKVCGQQLLDPNQIL